MAAKLGWPAAISLFSRNSFASFIRHESDIDIFVQNRKIYMDYMNTCAPEDKCVEERDSLAAIIDAVAPAAIGARHNTRNIALREAAVAAEVDAALRLAQLHFPLGAG